jgi:Protein of unknown function (DUF1194)
MKRRRFLGTAAAILAAASLASGAPAEGEPSRAAENDAVVDVNLVLAIDSSGSVTDDRFLLQEQGFASAFRNPKVIRAIRAGDNQSISVSVVEWTGPTLQELVVPWTLVKDERSAEKLAAMIANAPRLLMGGGTSISGAIDYSVKLLARCPYRSVRHVIDISVDGSNNIGRPAEQARDEAIQMGIIINGLPILTVEPDLDQYYRQSVIGGPGAFVIPVRNYNQFAKAILRKLVAEISNARPQSVRFAGGR